MNKKGIILYKTQYGSTEQYAQWLSEDTGLVAMDVQFVRKNDLEACDFIVIGSNVKWGKIMVADWMNSHWSWVKNKKLILYVVCGTYSDIEEQNALLRNNFSKRWINSFDYFSLPGKLDKRRLQVMDRVLLFLNEKLLGDQRAKMLLREGFDYIDYKQMGRLVKAVEVMDECASIYQEI